MQNVIFTKVGQFQYSSEAYIYKGKLEAEGIEVFIRDNHTVDSDPLVSNAIGGVKLFVKTEDYESAIKILEEISTFSVDNEGELIQCPNCGAEKAHLFTTINDLKSFFAFLFTLLVTTLPFYTKYKYKCAACNIEF